MFEWLRGHTPTLDAKLAYVWVTAEKLRAPLLNTCATAKETTWGREHTAISEAGGDAVRRITTASGATFNGPTEARNFVTGSWGPGPGHALLLSVLRTGVLSADVYLWEILSRHGPWSEDAQVDIASYPV